MRKLQVIFIIIITLSFPTILKAVEFSFRHYKAEDGLTFNTVRSIIQDRTGFIWFGTEDGLNRFDGHSFKEFRSSKISTNLIRSNYVSALFENNNGNIWIGTDNGISIYHPHSESFTNLDAKA